MSAAMANKSTLVADPEAAFEAAGGSATPNWVVDAIQSASRRIPLYQEMWRDIDIETGSPAERLERLPVWRVDEIREAIARKPPFGSELYDEDALLDIAYIHSSTGTTGQPRLLPLCRSDQDLLFANYARFYRFIGVCASDIACVAFTLGTPAGGWSLLRAAQAVGATLIPASSGKVTRPASLVDLVVRAGVTVLMGTPSYLAHVAEVGRVDGVDVSKSNVRLLIISGEITTPSLRRRLAEAWGADVRSFYANTDVSWVAAECQEGAERGGLAGLHVFSDVVAVEVLSDSGKRLPDGEYGEVVVTSRLRPSTPRIRFGTGDLGAISHDRCVCGRTGPRLLPLRGRVDDSIRFHGHTIWPQAVEEILTEEFGRHVEYAMQICRFESGKDQLRLYLEVRGGEHQSPDAAQRLLGEKLDVRFDVHFVGVGDLAELTGTAGGGKVQRYLGAGGNEGKIA